MLLRKTYRLPAWMLGAAAAGLMATPDLGWTQNPAQPQYRPPVKRPVSPRQPGGTPVVPATHTASEATIIQTQATAPGVESDVQRELRRLYEESGREMPQVPTSIQTQRPLPAANRTQAQPPPAPAQAGAQPQQIVAPTPSAPASTGNRVTSFFKRLLPGGGQSKPAPAPVPPAHVTPQPVPKSPTNYAPYATQQPRRLPPTTTVPTQSVPTQTAPLQQAAALPLPPSPAVAPAAPVATSAPVTQSAPRTQAAPPTVIARQPDPVFTEPAATGDEDLNFEPPIIVSAPEAERTAPPQSIAAPSVHPLAEPEVELVPAPVEIVTAKPTEFPDPFPEMSEEEADDDSEEEFESPFVGLTLDEEPFPAATPVEAAPEADPLADPLPSPAATEAPALVVDAAAEPEAEAPALSAPNTLPALPMPGVEEALPAAELPVPKAQVVQTAPQDEYAEKMKQIRDRGGMKGLKGFCPVTLRDQRELKDSQPEFQSTFRGQKFHFATAEAKARFDQDPAHYAPAAYGADVVTLIRDKDVAEGSLDFAAWYKGNLYLFANEQTYAAFVAEPVKYAAPEGLE